MNKKKKGKYLAVTKTFFPNQKDYEQQLSRIWENQWLTNRGELVIELEEELKSYLGVKNLFSMTNGTLPIQVALKVLAGQGEVITTPFSYVATTSSIVWENCTPVFVDIEPDYLTIDAEKIEGAITPNTTAILATHVYGNPCDVEKIEAIANKHKLKVIYDAAHAFGVKYKGKSLFNFGHVSTCSFHATKIFHTGEGGAIFCNDEDLSKELFYHHNFGHDGPLKFHGIGINAKMSELQAAMGLSVLPHMDYIIKSRQKVVDYYNEHLDFNNLERLKLREGTDWNYSYYPVIFPSEQSLLKAEKLLLEQDILARRYFFPSLNTLPYVRSTKMEIAESIASRVLCLPIFVGIDRLDQERVINIINAAL